MPQHFNQIKHLLIDCVYCLPPCSERKLHEDRGLVYSGTLKYPIHISYSINTCWIITSTNNPLYILKENKDTKSSLVEYYYII